MAYTSYAGRAVGAAWSSAPRGFALHATPASVAAARAAMPATLRKVFPIPASRVFEGELFIKGVRVGPMQRRRDDKTPAASFAYPGFRSGDECAAHASRPNALIHHEQRELSERRLVIDRMANVHRGKSDHHPVHGGDERANVRVGVEPRQARGYHIGVRWIAELRAELGQRLGVARERLADRGMRHRMPVEGRRW